MSALEVTSYLVLVVYMVSFAGLAAAKAKQSGERPWFLARRNAASVAIGWTYIGSLALATTLPLVRAWIGDPFPSDPVRMALDGLATDITGHALMGVGACIAMVSQMHTSDLWRFGTNDEPEEGFIADGPYALSRNPVFLGQILLFAGLFLVVPGAAQCLVTLLLFGAIAVRARIEEHMLLGTYGERYERYRRRVRRWVGTRPAPS